MYGRGKLELERKKRGSVFPLFKSQNKMKILLFIFTLFISFPSFSQDLLITYKVSTEGLLNEEQKKRLSQGSQDYYVKVENNFKYLVYLLKIKENKSLFHREQEMQNEGNRGLSLAASRAGFPGSFYSDSEVGKVFHEYDSYGPKYLVSSSLQELKWKISKETKIVTGLKTFKATAQETYDTGSEKKIWTITAWFAPEVNKPFGPGGYGGLPGLILELDRGLKTYTAKNIKEVDLKKDEVNIPASGKKITKEEFEAIGRKMSELRSSFN